MVPRSSVSPAGTGLYAMTPWSRFSHASPSVLSTGTVHQEMCSVMMPCAFCPLISSTKRFTSSYGFGSLFWLLCLRWSWLSTSLCSFGHSPASCCWDPALDLPDRIILTSSSESVHTAIGLYCIFFTKMSTALIIGISLPILLVS